MAVVLLALASAACNAAATVLQRLAAASAPAGTALRPSLLGCLVRRRVWLVGMAAMTASFVLQAAALDSGPLSVVQPLLVAKLPLTVLIAPLVLPALLRLRRQDWVAVIALSGGLAVALLLTQPAGTGHRPSGPQWWVAVSVGALLVAALTNGARRRPGPTAATLLGAASGTAFGFTAAFVNEMTAVMGAGVASLAVSWSTYAVAGAGALAVVLQQNALQAGSLAASQPASTSTGPVVSVLLGVLRSTNA